MSDTGIRATYTPERAARNRKLSWLQIAQTRHGWFVIGIDPDDECGLDFQTIGGPMDTREAARDYLREVSSWPLHDENDAPASGTAKFLVRLYREVPVCQYQEVEVEASDEADAERRAILVVEGDDFDEERWEVVDCVVTHPVLVPPYAVWIEPLPRA
jgi:hypothetical protein